MVHAGPLGLCGCLVTGLDHLIDQASLLEVKGSRRHETVAPGPLGGPRVQVAPLVGADLTVDLALHERVDEAHLAVRTFPHQPELARLVERRDGVFGVALHHVGDGGEFVGCAQDHRSRPQEVAGHLVGAGESAPQDRIRAWQGHVLGQRRSRRLGNQAHRFPQEEGISAGQPEQAVDDGLIGLVARSHHHAHVLTDVGPLQRNHGQGHVSSRGPFSHQVGELGVVAELFLLDGGGYQDRDLPQLAEQVIQEVQGVRVSRVQVIDQQEQTCASGGGLDEDAGQFLVDAAEAERTFGELLPDAGQERPDERHRVEQVRRGAGQRPPDLVGSAAEIGSECLLHGQEGFGAPAQAPYGDNGHPALTGLRSCLDGEPRFADTRLAQDQDGMPGAGIDYPGDVLAQQIKLELPVNQWFPGALAARPRCFAVVIVPCRHKVMTWTFATNACRLPRLKLSA